MKVKVTVELTLEAGSIDEAFQTLPSFTKFPKSMIAVELKAESVD